MLQNAPGLQSAPPKQTPPDCWGSGSCSARSSLTGDDLKAFVPLPASALLSLRGSSSGGGLMVLSAPTVPASAQPRRPSSAEGSAVAGTAGAGDSQGSQALEPWYMWQQNPAYSASPGSSTTTAEAARSAFQVSDLALDQQVGAGGAKAVLGDRTVDYSTMHAGSQPHHSTTQDLG